MSQCQLAVARNSSWRSIAEDLVRQLGPAPSCFNLAFLYATDTLAADLDKVLSYLQEHTSILHWVGTVGIGLCAGKVEIYGEPAVAVLLTEFPEDQFRVFEFGPMGIEDFLQTDTIWANTVISPFAVLHGDPRAPETPHILEQMSEHFPDGYWVGGLSSSQSNYVQIADQLSSATVSGVLFRDAHNIHVSMTQGCTPIGPRHRITACDRNFIYKIDDQPALDVFKQDIGEVLAKDLRNVAGFIFAGLPTLADHPHDYKVRNIIGIDPNSQALAIGDLTSLGQTIQFCKRDSQSAREDHQRTLLKLKERLGRKTIRGGLYFTCLGRGRSLFGENSMELQLIFDALGEFPLAGFFANGEIARQEIYGYTGVLTLFT